MGPLAAASAELLLSLKSQPARNVLQSGDAEGNCVALARQSPKTAAVGPKSNSSSLPCSHADSVVCLNVGGRIESKIVAGAHSGERRHRQSRGEESLQEFKPVSAVVGRDRSRNRERERFGVCLPRRGPIKGGYRHSLHYSKFDSHSLDRFFARLVCPPRSYACSPRPR